MTLDLTNVTVLLGGLVLLAAVVEPRVPALSRLKLNLLALGLLLIFAISIASQFERMIGVTSIF